MGYLKDEKRPELLNAHLKRAAWRVLRCGLQQPWLSKDFGEFKSTVAPSCYTPIALGGMEWRTFNPSP